MLSSPACRHTNWRTAARVMSSGSTTSLHTISYSSSARGRCSSRCRPPDARVSKDERGVLGNVGPCEPAILSSLSCTYTQTSAISSCTQSILRTCVVSFRTRRNRLAVSFDWALPPPRQRTGNESSSPHVRIQKLRQRLVRVLVRERQQHEADLGHRDRRRLIRE